MPSEVRVSPERHVKLFRNGTQLTREPLREPLAPGDDLEIIAAIAGG